MTKKSSSQNSFKILFWIFIALALLVAIFLIAGIVIENRRQGPPDFQKPPPSSSVLPPSPSLSPDKITTSGVRKNSCKSWMQKKIAGLTLSAQDHVLGWVPDSLNRRMVVWDEKQKLFRTYLLSLSLQGGQFTLDKEYPLYCKDTGSSHCLSAFGIEVSSLQLQSLDSTDWQKQKGSPTGQSSYYSELGGVLDLSWQQKLFSIPFQLDRVRGLEFFPFLNSCRTPSSARRWVSLQRENEVYHLGWSLQTPHSLIYLVAPSYSQPLALNSGGESPANIYKLVDGSLVPSSCSEFQNDSVILDASSRGSLWAVLFESKKNRKILLFELEKGTLHKLGDWDSEQFSGNPQRLQILADSSLWVESSNWLGTKITQQRIYFRGNKNHSVERIKNQGPGHSDPEYSLPGLVHWLVSLESFRWSTGTPIPSPSFSSLSSGEDLALLSEGTLVKDWSLVLYRKKNDTQTELLSLLGPTEIEKSDPRHWYWDRLTPEVYFVLNMSERHGQGVGHWIQCDHAL